MKVKISNIPTIRQQTRLLAFVVFTLPSLTAQGQAWEIEKLARINFIETRKIAIQEAKAKILANNAWIEATNDNKEIRSLQKNIEKQKNMINQLEKGIEISSKILNMSKEERSPLSGKKLKASGVMRFQGVIESEKIIKEYRNKVDRAKKNASIQKSRSKQWAIAADRWNQVINIVEQLMKAEEYTSDLYFLAAEVLEPGIVSGDDERLKRDLEIFRQKIIHDYEIEEDILF